MQNQQSPASASVQPAQPAQPIPDPGFRLPGQDSAPAARETREGRESRESRDPGAAPKDAASAARPGSLEVAPAPASVVTDTSSRDLAIGGTAFLILLVIFFFARNAYVHQLVVRRVAPSTASNAGWLMFLGFGFISAAAVLALVNASKFLTFAITAPLLAVGLIALVAMLLVGRR